MAEEDLSEWVWSSLYGRWVWVDSQDEIIVRWRDILKTETEPVFFRRSVSKPKDPPSPADRPTASAADRHAAARRSIDAFYASEAKASAPPVRPPLPRSPPPPPPQPRPSAPSLGLVSPPPPSSKRARSASSSPPQYSHSHSQQKKARLHSPASQTTDAAVCKTLMMDMRGFAQMGGRLPVRRGAAAAALPASDPDSDSSSGEEAATGASGERKRPTTSDLPLENNCWLNVVLMSFLFQDNRHVDRTFFGERSPVQIATSLPPDPTTDGPQVHLRYRLALIATALRTGAPPVSSLPVQDLLAEQAGEKKLVPRAAQGAESGALANPRDAAAVLLGLFPGGSTGGDRRLVSVELPEEEGLEHTTRLPSPGIAADRQADCLWVSVRRTGGAGHAFLRPQESFSPPGRPGVRMTLSSVVVFLGEKRPHYVAYLRCTGDSTWYLFDDYINGRPTNLDRGRLVPVADSLDALLQARPASRTPAAAAAAAAASAGDPRRTKRESGRRRLTVGNRIHHLFYVPVRTGSGSGI